MLIMQKLRWIVLAGAALALSGCVVPPPPVAYNDGYAQQPVYSEPVSQYYESSDQVYYEEPNYAPQYAYRDPYYYGAGYPVIGTSLGYTVYSNNSRRKYHGNRHHSHKGDKSHNGKGKKKSANKRTDYSRSSSERARVEKRSDRELGRNKSERRRYNEIREYRDNSDGELLIKKKLRVRGNREGVRASDGNR